jgi:DNA-directed RNA polymerase sigma subunit (sigma70/sigma32)
MGICRERVRQLEKAAIRKLKQMGADFGLEDFLE